MLGKGGGARRSMVTWLVRMVTDPVNKRFSGFLKLYQSYRALQLELIIWLIGARSNWHLHRVFIAIDFYRFPVFREKKILKTSLAD